MINYDKLSNREIEKLRKQYFGDTLKSIKEIGRESVIEKFRQYNTFNLIKEKHPKTSAKYSIYRNRKQEREWNEMYRYVLWATSNVQNYMSLREFMRYK